MCGIAGVAMARGAPPPDPATLAALATALGHRGPDGAGHSVVGRIALVHTRLAIIDLEGGDQPLFAGPAALVANGEVYNYRALQESLGDAPLATGSDCEPPLHLWLREGPAYAERLRGMYAIAIHERADRTLTLTRDPFGIKPLYVAQLRGGLAFASEPQALLAAGLVGRGVRAAARDELLQLQFTTGAETIFPGISRVLPGETLRVQDGHVLDRSRRPALPEGGPEDIGEEAALDRLDRPWWRAWGCTSRATCRTACSCRAAWTAPRCWRPWRAPGRAPCWPSPPGSTCRRRRTSAGRRPPWRGPRARATPRSR